MVSGFRPLTVLPSVDGVIELRELTKSYGARVAVDGLSVRRPAGGGDRLPRPERIRQVDDDADDPRPGCPGRRRGTDRRRPVPRSANWPLQPVGALLDAGAFHPGRSARAHLAALAASNDIPGSRVEQVLRIVGLSDAARGAPARTRSACASGSALPWRCSATRACSCSTSRSTGWILRASAGSGTCCAALAAEGRTVFVSSHLIAEMALTADRLVVIGRGRLLAETAVAELAAGEDSLEDAFFRLTSQATDYRGLGAS